MRMNQSVQLNFWVIITKFKVLMNLLIYFFVEFFNHNLYDLEERHNYTYIYFAFCLIPMLNLDVDYGNYMYT